MDNRYNPQRVAQARQIVIERLPLTRLIDSYGINMHGERIVCPFHNDDNPSCFVSDDMKTYHCFGCGAKGTVVGFAKDYNNIYKDEDVSQVEMIKRLSDKFSIDIPNLEDRLLIRPKRKKRKQKPVDVERVLKKKLDNYEVKAKVIKEKKLRLKVYQVLDDYYFGYIDEAEAIKKIKGEWE